MKPITFQSSAALPRPAEVYFAWMLDLSLWPEFTGWGPLPGIRAAEFETRGPGEVGTRIRVTNTDGSTHVEEIIDWRPPVLVRLRMSQFTQPLSRIATHFVETMEFTESGSGSHVVRTFEMHPTSRGTRPLLWLISLLARRAIARHLRRMAAG